MVRMPGWWARGGSDVLRDPAENTIARHPLDKRPGCECRPGDPEAHFPEDHHDNPVLTTEQRRYAAADEIKGRLNKVIFRNKGPRRMFRDLSNETLTRFLLGEEDI